MLVGFALCTMSLVMWLLWLYQRRSRDSGIVDVVWGLGVWGCAVWYAYFLDGLTTRKMAVLAVTSIWSLRLSGYVLWRVLRMPEDGRYETLKQQWGSDAQTKMCWFYQFQAVASVLFSLPMLLVLDNAAAWRGWDAIGVGIGFLAIAGEALSDLQLHRFRNGPLNRGKVCRQGLWAYSRHPNYFFEWMHWWAYPMFAASTVTLGLAALFPLMMLYFILFKTGIPPTEAQALRSRGEAYRQYQQEVSAFVPWWPRSQKQRLGRE